MLARSCEANTPRRSFYHFPDDRKTSPRFSRDTGFFQGRVRLSLWPRGADAGWALPGEAARREGAGDDLHEGLDAHACVVRGGDVAARWARALSLAARRAAR